jgi:hypothetical protein
MAKADFKKIAIVTKYWTRRINATIFSNTVKIATTALQAYNVANQQYQLAHEMILAPTMLYSRFLSPTSDLMMMQQISNTYGNSSGWVNSANTGNGAAAAYQQASVPRTPNMIPGYGPGSNHRHRRFSHDHQPASTGYDPSQSSSPANRHRQP